MKDDVPDSTYGISGTLMEIPPSAGGSLWLPAGKTWLSRRPLQHMRTLLSAVTGLAGVALALGQAEQAARLLGAVEAAQDDLDVAQISLAHYARRITVETRNALEAPTYERALAAGRLLPLTDAVAEALAIANGVIGVSDNAIAEG